MSNAFKSDLNNGQFDDRFSQGDKNITATSPYMLICLTIDVRYNFTDFNGIDLKVSLTHCSTVSDY